jgi:hypothetical protein
MLYQSSKVVELKEVSVVPVLMYCAVKADVGVKIKIRVFLVSVLDESEWSALCSDRSTPVQSG